MCNNFDLAAFYLANLDSISKVTGSVIHLNLVMKELLEGGNIEDLIARWLGCIDDELLYINETSR